MPLPDLPSGVYTHLGVMPICVVDRIHDDERRGECDIRERVIRIASGYDHAAQWQALGHELTHAILWDGGAHHSLTDRQTEIVCDAFGTWFAAAVASGAVSLKSATPA